MANIIEKAFDVSKNIVRTIFLGKPNLFTTSDLNRQIQAFKYQMDSIENRLGAESDMEIDFDITDIQISCMVRKGTYFRVNGLNIPLPNPSDTFVIDAEHRQEVYFYVWGNFTRKTYANDPTHEIAGAKFSDGTSLPAADQLVLSEVHYAITDDLGDITRGDYDFSFIIAKVNVLNEDTKYIRINYKKAGHSVMIDSVNTLEYITQPDQGHEDDPLCVGEDFSTCINKLISKDVCRQESIGALRNQVSPITLSNGIWKQSKQGSISFSYRIYHGMLHIIVYPNHIQISENIGQYFATCSGDFEDADEANLREHFSRLNYTENSPNLGALLSGLGCIYFPIGRGSISGKTSSADTAFGVGEYGLCLKMSGSQIQRVSVMGYISNVIIFAQDGSIKYARSGPVNIIDVIGVTFRVEPASFIIPLSE